MGLFLIHAYGLDASDSFFFSTFLKFEHLASAKEDFACKTQTGYHIVLYNILCGYPCFSMPCVVSLFVWHLVMTCLISSCWRSCYS